MPTAQYQAGSLDTGGVSGAAGGCQPEVGGGLHPPSAARWEKRLMLRQYPTPELPGSKSMKK